MKKILILSGSPRKGGNSDTLCDEFKRGAEEILEKMNAADVLVLASPVYFYAVDAQMKALIDRSVAQWLKIRDKEFYYIMTAAEDGDTVMDCTLECLRGFARCLKGSVERGVVYGKGVYEARAVKNTPAMREAYDMGRTV